MRAVRDLPGFPKGCMSRVLLLLLHLLRSMLLLTLVSWRPVEFSPLGFSLFVTHRIRTQGSRSLTGHSASRVALLRERGGKNNQRGGIF